MIDFKKKTTYLVLAFILLLAYMLAECEDAQAGSSSISIAPETAFIGGDKVPGSAIFFKERFAPRYEATVFLFTDIANEGPNGGVQIQRIVGNGPFQLGFGATGWKNQSSAWDSHFTFALTIRYTLKAHYFVELNHWSTGGTSDRNSGIDQISFGYRF